MKKYKCITPVRTGKTLNLNDVMLNDDDAKVLLAGGHIAELGDAVTIETELKTDEGDGVVKTEVEGDELTDDGPAPEKSLEEHTVGELKALCDSKGIAYKSKPLKVDLIDLLQE